MLFVGAATEGVAPDDGVAALIDAATAAVVDAGAVPGAHAVSTNVARRATARFIDIWVLSFSQL
jgi:hypothetical protein